MKSSVSTAIVDLVRRANPDLEFRLEAQAEALRENECIDPVIGQWVDTHGVEYLKSVLDLDDFNFAKRFSSIAQLDQQQRQQMRAEVGSHLDRCKHCSLAHGYELELDARMMRAFRENKTEFLQLLDEEEADLGEGEHRNEKSWTNTSERQRRAPCEPPLVIEPLVEPI
jgi:hypothetical protein